MTVVELERLATVLGDLGHRMSELVAKLSCGGQHSLSKISSGTTHPITCPHVEVYEKINVHVHMDEVVFQSRLAILPPVIRLWTIMLVFRSVLFEGESAAEAGSCLYFTLAERLQVDANVRGSYSQVVEDFLLLRCIEASWRADAGSCAAFGITLAGPLRVHQSGPERQSVVVGDHPSRELHRRVEHELARFVVPVRKNGIFDFVCRAVCRAELPERHAHKCRVGCLELSDLRGQVAKLLVWELAHTDVLHLEDWKRVVCQ